MKVLLINGSTRENGNTSIALKECAAELEKYGIEAEIFWIGTEPVYGCRGCGGCRKCGSCVLKNDILPEMVSKMKEADGYIIGSPVYYAGPNGSLQALLDRAFFSGSRFFKHKPAASVAVCRRGGASATFDRLNKYFTISEMPVVSSQYWNSVHGMTPGEATQDAEGLQTMRTLAKNMAFMLKALDGQTWPEPEAERQSTNFIR